MPVRGGRVTHAVAASGWSVLGGVGAVLGLVITLLYVLSGGDADSTVEGRVVGGLLLFVPGGALLIGLLFGIPLQFAARAWLKTPSPAELAAAREVEPAAPPVPDGLTEGSRWAESFGACADAVTAYRAVLGTLEDGPARDWFADLGRQLDGELDEALRLARLGESLSAVGSDGDTARTVADRLEAARAGFTDTTERAAAVALELHRHADLSGVRAQLEMLAEQAPQLRST